MQKKYIVEQPIAEWSPKSFMHIKLELILNVIILRIFTYLFHKDFSSLFGLIYAFAT